MAAFLDLDYDYDTNQNQFAFKNAKHDLTANFTHDIITDVSSTFGKFDDIPYQIKVNSQLDDPEPLPTIEPYEWQDDVQNKITSYGNADETILVLDTTNKKNFTFYYTGQSRNKLSIDFGDGQYRKNIYPSTTINNITHTYAQGGNFVIKIGSQDKTKRALKTIAFNTVAKQNNNIVAVKSIENGIEEISSMSFYGESMLTSFHCCDNTTLYDIDYIFAKPEDTGTLLNTWNHMTDICISGCTMITDFPFYDYDWDFQFFPQLTSINACAFRNCSSLTSIKLGRSAVEKIYDRAFENCTSLTSVQLYDSQINASCNKINYVGHLAFSNCALTSFNNNDSCNVVCYSNNSVTQADEIVFEDDAFENCQGLQTVAFHAFILSSPKLKRLNFLPNTIKNIIRCSIDGEDGYGNNGITEIKLPCSVTQSNYGWSYQGPMNHSLFQQCFQLTSIVGKSMPFNGMSGSKYSPLCYDDAYDTNLRYLSYPNNIEYAYRSSTEGFYERSLVDYNNNIHTIIVPDSVSNYLGYIPCCPTLSNLRVPFIGSIRGIAGNNVFNDSPNSVSYWDSFVTWFYTNGEVPPGYVNFYNPCALYAPRNTGVFYIYPNIYNNYIYQVPKTLTNLSVGQFHYLVHGAFAFLSSLQTITFENGPYNDNPADNWYGLSVFHGCHNLLSVYFKNIDHTVLENYGFSPSSSEYRRWTRYQGGNGVANHTVKYIFTDGYYEWNNSDRFVFHAN